MQLPTLYKKATADDTIYMWRVWTDGSSVHVEYGHLNGKLQHTRSTAVPKNVGRANETTGPQQAEREARSQWEEKRSRDSYVEDIERARKGETDHAGGVELMKAHPYPKYGKKMRYPAHEQRKLDGMRGYLEVRPDGHVTFWSYNREPILTMGHVVEAATRLRVSQTLPLDGELYCHGMSLQQIISIVKRADHPDHEKLQFHVFDAVTKGPFSERLRIIEEVATRFGEPLRLVETRKVASELEAMEVFAEFLAERYEGAIVRDSDAPYEHGRSQRVLKIKEFQDREDRIVGAIEGKGKLEGHVGAFTCEMADGKRFEVKLSGDTDRLRELFLNPSLWERKYMKYKHQGFTDGGVPRFPVGMTILDLTDIDRSPKPKARAKS